MTTKLSNLNKKKSKHSLIKHLMNIEYGTKSLKMCTLPNSYKNYLKNTYVIQTCTRPGVFVTSYLLF